MKRFLFFFVPLLVVVGIEAKPATPYLDVGEKISLVDDISQSVVTFEKVAILDFSFIDLRVGLSQIGVDVGEYKLPPILDVQTDGLFMDNLLSKTAKDHYDADKFPGLMQKANKEKSRTGFTGFGIGQINRWTISTSRNVTEHN
jgi:hypothetical protein